MHRADDTFWSDVTSERFNQPEQLLWFSVLEHALRDADHHREIVKLPKRQPKDCDPRQKWLFDVEVSTERHDDLLELLAWFESPIEHVAGTFGFICNCLGISDEARETMVRWVRGKIRQRAKLAA